MFVCLSAATFTYPALPPCLALGTQITTAIEWLDVKDSKDELAQANASSEITTYLKERLNDNKFLFLGALAIYRWYFGDFGVSRTIEAVQPALQQLQSQQVPSLRPYLQHFMNSMAYLGDAMYRVVINIYS